MFHVLLFKLFFFDMIKEGNMEQIRHFFDLLEKDTSLMEKLEKKRDDFSGTRAEFISDVLVPFAEDAGFSITAEDFTSYFSKRGELDDDDLDSVSGGSNVVRFPGLFPRILF